MKRPEYPFHFLSSTAATIYLIYLHNSVFLSYESFTKDEKSKAVKRLIKTYDLIQLPLTKRQKCNNNIKFFELDL